MKLILLHGAPAVGKLSVARALVEATSAKLLDNHAAIDIAKTIFDFGGPGFWELVQTTRVSVLEAAAKQKIPLMIMTYCYSSPEDLIDFEQFCEAVERRKGEVCPVFLTCSEEEALRRVGNEDRKTRGKITTENGLKKFNSSHRFGPVPRESCIQIDSENSTVNSMSDQIITHFSLNES